MAYHCLIEIHSVSARRKGKHEYVCCAVFLYPHWNMLQLQSRRLKSSLPAVILFNIEYAFTLLWDNFSQNSCIHALYMQKYNITIWLLLGLLLVPIENNNQTKEQTKLSAVLPGKNPGENLWNDTDITFEVKEKASSTPANNFQAKHELVILTSIATANLQLQIKYTLVTCSQGCGNSLAQPEMYY